MVDWNDNGDGYLEAYADNLRMRVFTDAAEPGEDPCFPWDAWDYAESGEAPTIEQAKAEAIAAADNLLKLALEELRGCTHE